MKKFLIISYLITILGLPIIGILTLLELWVVTKFYTIILLTLIWVSSINSLIGLLGIKGFSIKIQK